MSKYNIDGTLKEGELSIDGVTIPDAPVDGQLYGRQNSAWAVITGGGGGGIPDAPQDGKQYARKDAAWVEAATDKIDISTIASATEKGGLYWKEDTDNDDLILSNENPIPQ